MIKPYRELSCARCNQDKKTCDKDKPECGRCQSRGESCLYRFKEIAVGRKRRKDDHLPTTVMRTTVIPSVKRIVHDELMLDKYFLHSCLENFDLMMGVLLTFKSDAPSSDLSLLHSNVALKVRTDSVLASVCKAMGWVTQAKLYLDRARHNVTELLSDDDRSDSSESSTAIGLLSFASYGEDLWLSKYLIANAAKKRFPGFEIDMSKPINSFNEPFFAAISNATVVSIMTDMMATLYQRVHLRAHNVRRALEVRLSREEIDRYGAFDYADHRGGYDSEECMDLELARRLLAEFNETDRRLKEETPRYSAKVKEVARIFFERLAVVANAVRCSLEYYTGDFAAAKISAEKSFSAFGSVSSVLLFYGALTDYVMVIDACIGMRDRALFERGMQIMRRMAPVFTPAEKIVISLSDYSVTSLFEEEEVVSVKISTLKTGAVFGSSSEVSSRETLMSLENLEDVASKELDSWLSALT